MTSLPHASTIFRCFPNACSKSACPSPATVTVATNKQAASVVIVFGSHTPSPPLQQIGMSFSSHVLAVAPAAVIGLVAGLLAIAFTVANVKVRGCVDTIWVCDCRHWPAGGAAGHSLHGRQRQGAGTFCRSNKHV